MSAVCDLGNLDSWARLHRPDAFAWTVRYGSHSGLDRANADRCILIHHSIGGTMTQETHSNSGQIVLELALQPLGGWGDEPEEDLPHIPFAIEVSLDDAVKFPDVVTLIFEVDIDENDESDQASDQFVQRVVDFIKQWLRDNHVQAIGEIEAVVLLGFVVVDAGERSTEAQQAKYDRFSQLRDADEIIQGLLEIVGCTDLTDDDLGETWGVTLWPEQKILARVNAGSRVLAEVWQSGRGLVFRIMVIGEFEIPETFGDMAIMRPGFEVVEDSMMVSVLSERLLELIDLPGVEERIAAHAAIGGRKLPRTNWHNPMSEIFIFSGDLQS
jgi:hypothetical protein